MNLRSAIAELSLWETDLVFLIDKLETIMHVFHMYLLSAYCIPGTVLGPGGSAIYRADKAPSLRVCTLQPFSGGAPRAAQRRGGKKSPSASHRWKHYVGVPGVGHGDSRVGFLL